MCLKKYCTDCEHIFCCGYEECEICNGELDEIYFCDICKEEVDIDNMIEYSIDIDCYEACEKCYNETFGDSKED